MKVKKRMRLSLFLVLFFLQPFLPFAVSLVSHAEFAWCQEKKDVILKKTSELQSAKKAEAKKTEAGKTIETSGNVAEKSAVEKDKSYHEFLKKTNRDLKPALMKEYMPIPAFKTEIR